MIRRAVPKKKIGTVDRVVLRPTDPNRVAMTNPRGPTSDWGEIDEEGFWKLYRTKDSSATYKLQNGLDSATAKKLADLGCKINGKVIEAPKASCNQVQEILKKA